MNFEEIIQPINWRPYRPRDFEVKIDVNIRNNDIFRGRLNDPIEFQPATMNIIKRIPSNQRRQRLDEAREIFNKGRHYSIKTIIVPGLRTTNFTIGDQLFRVWWWSLSDAHTDYFYNQIKALISSSKYQVKMLPEIKKDEFLSHWEDKLVTKMQKESSQGLTCAICFENMSRYPLADPCPQCKNKSIHQHCLKTMHQNQRYPTCPLCRYEYVTELPNDAQEMDDLLRFVYQMMRPVQ